MKKYIKELTNLSVKKSINTEGAKIDVNNALFSSGTPKRILERYIEKRENGSSLREIMVEFSEEQEQWIDDQNMPFDYFKAVFIEIHKNAISELCAELLD